MSWGDYLAGAIALCATVAAISVSAVQARRATLSDWVGAPARLAEAVIGVTELVLIAELLGGVGALRRWPLVLSSIVVAIATTVLCGRRQSGARHARTMVTGRTASRGALLLGLAIVALALNPWLRQVVGSLGNGMREFDTLNYHMPFAVQFAQTASITALHYVGNPPTTFFPQNSELVHAIGIVLMTRDVLSPLLNAAWLGLALLAAWCIGRRWGVAPSTTAAAALVVSVRVMVTSQAGTAKNDIVALALLLAAFGVLANAERSRAAIALAALAGGLALGTRLNLIAPVLALAAVSIAAGRTSRRATAGWWTAGILVGGGFWYLRNALAAGNPLPWFALKLDGLINLPSTTAPVDCGQTSVAHYLTKPSFVSSNLVPHLAVAWGGRWWLVLGLAAFGAGAGLLARGDSILRAIAIVAIVSAVAYVFTPATAGGPGATCFEFNTRFAAPAIALGLIAVPIVLAGWGAPPLVAPALILIALVSDVQEPFDKRAVLATVLLIGVVVVLATGVLRRPPRALRIGGIALAAVLVMVAGRHELQNYLASHYRGANLAEPVDQVALALDRLQGARIAVAGLNEIYPLYSPSLANRVQLPVRRVSTARFAPYATCGGWLQALQRGRFDYVVVANQSSVPAREAGWTMRFPGARELDSMGTERQGSPWRWELFRLPSGPHPDATAACTGSQPRRASL